MRNLPPIQQIPQGATTEQIEDIQQQNALALAGLREDIQRGRVEDIQGLFSIPQRFRSQQEAGAGVFDPFERQSSSIDVQSGDFEKSTSEGAPIASPMLPESTFSQSEEEEEMGLMAGEDVRAVERLQPRESIKTGGGSAKIAIPEGELLRNQALYKLGVKGKPESETKKPTVAEWNTYLNTIRRSMNIVIPNVQLTKNEAKAEAEKLIKQRELQLEVELGIKE